MTKTELYVVNDRNALYRDSAETEASAIFTEASAEASAESLPKISVENVCFFKFLDYIFSYSQNVPITKWYLNFN